MECSFSQRSQSIQCSNEHQQIKCDALGEFSPKLGKYGDFFIGVSSNFERGRQILLPKELIERKHKIQYDFLFSGNKFTKNGIRIIHEKCYQKVLKVLHSSPKADFGVYSSLMKKYNIYLLGMLKIDEHDDINQKKISKTKRNIHNSLPVYGHHLVKSKNQKHASKESSSESNESYDSSLENSSSSSEES
ncbi:hypothetical protein BpHYR1_030453 [Brachionus plicatilis]|uniref:Uncharacterized protein n=1 Tax=Brachionus plicatilis TaxID=10195 RepID=A0A3M7QUS9_BRAPC|nr:hypothetical protein BpHYR1_030453 [Brachionus plicatilis]